MEEPRIVTPAPQIDPTLGVGMVGGVKALYAVLRALFFIFIFPYLRVSAGCFPAYL